MLQQVMTSPGEIVFREVETPVPQAGEVLIRMMRIGIPRTVGMQYRRAFQSVREALCGNGIPVWFCLAWNLLGLDSSLLTSISSGALFQARNNCVRKRKKPSSQNRRTAGKGRRKVSALFENKKAGILEASAPQKIPADSHMIIF